MLLCDDVDANIVIVIVLGVQKPIVSAGCGILFFVCGVLCCFWAPSALIVWLKPLF